MKARQSLLSALFQDDKAAQEFTISDENGTPAEQMILQYYKRILALRASVMDKHAGIRSSFMTCEGQIVWRRVATMADIMNSNPRDSLFAYINYRRLFYAYLIAAITIAKINHVDQEPYLQGIAYLHDLALENEDLAVPDINQIRKAAHIGKGDLINQLCAYCPQYDKRTMSHMLDQAKDWVGLAMPSLVIATVIHGDESLNLCSLCILDEPCGKLTDEQTKLFQDLESQDWFIELSIFQQQLIEYYQEPILSGTRVIPSQLRGMVPACKNAYKQSIYVMKPDQSIEQLNEYYHCGTVAHLSHKDPNTASRITRDNLAQQKMISQTDALVMTCLNSKMGDFLAGPYERMHGRAYSMDDSAIISLTNTAAAALDSEHIYYAKLCLNGFKKIEPNNYQGIDAIIRTINHHLDLITDTQNDLKTLIQLHLRAITWLKWQITFSVTDVKELEIIAHLTRAVFLNNQLVMRAPDLGLTSLAIWFGCASGENRTGITYYHVIGETLFEYFSCGLDTEKQLPLKTKIYQSIAKSQHIHILTGNQGNTFGSEGIRGKSSGSFRHHHAKDDLITNTSDIKLLLAWDENFTHQLNQLMIVLNKKNNPLTRQLYEESSRLLDDVIFMDDKKKQALNNALYGATEMLSQGESKQYARDELQHLAEQLKDNPRIRDILIRLAKAQSLSNQQIIKEFGFFNKAVIEIELTPQYSSLKNSSV